MELNEWEKLNKELSDQLFAAIDFERISTLHTFLPIKGNREPDTWRIIERLREEFPDIDLVVSRTNWSNRSLEHYLLEKETDLVINKYGIPEPVTGKRIGNEQIDAVLVPLLIADRQGHRVGYGGGFYDRFLAQLGPEVVLAGLSLCAPIATIADAVAHDVKMHYCIYPDGIVHYESTS